MNKMIVNLDYQVRSMVIIYNRNMPIEEGPVFSQTDNNPIKMVIDSVNSGLQKMGEEVLSMKDYRIEFNGSSWARCNYIHLKMMIKPSVFIDKNIYPKWSTINTRRLKTLYNLRFDSKLNSAIERIAQNMPNDTSSLPNIFGNGTIHGYVSKDFVTLENMRDAIDMMENFLWKTHKGRYRIVVKPVSDTEFIVLAIVHKLEYNKVHGIKNQKNTYVKYQRHEYQEAEEILIVDKDYIFPTSEKLSSKEIYVKPPKTTKHKKHRKRSKKT